MKNPNHTQDIKDAYGYYFRIKKKLMTWKDPKKVLVVQDYSQYHAGGGFYQSPILCVYFYDPDSQTVKSKFYHIFRKNDNKKDNETNKNDKWFTMSAWNFLIKTSEIFKDRTDFYIISDGAGKHFKNRTMHLYWYCLWKRYRVDGNGRPGKIRYLQYAYFKSNHGNNPSDTGSSHGKQQVKYWTIRNQRKTIKDESKLSEIIETRQNHDSDVIKVFSQTNDPDSPAYDQMRKNHLFIYDIDGKKVSTYHKGFDHDNGLPPKEVMIFTDQQIEGMEELFDKIDEHQYGEPDIPRRPRPTPSRVLPNRQVTVHQTQTDRQRGYAERDGRVRYIDPPSIGPTETPPPPHPQDTASTKLEILDTMPMAPPPSVGEERDEDEDDDESTGSRKGTRRRSSRRSSRRRR